MEFTSRLAVSADVPALMVLMDAAIAGLQRAFLDEGQIASSRAIMGIDTELIEDGTYFVVEWDGDIAGCGGWSRRATLYGGNQTPGRDSHLLDPAIEPARVRAMYTNPAYARRGVGRLILSLCEAAAAAAGFTRLELMSTPIPRTASGHSNAWRIPPVGSPCHLFGWRSPSTRACSTDLRPRRAGAWDPRP